MLLKLFSVLLCLITVLNKKRRIVGEMRLYEPIIFCPISCGLSGPDKERPRGKSLSGMHGKQVSADQDLIGISSFIPPKK